MVLDVCAKVVELCEPTKNGDIFLTSSSSIQGQHRQSGTYGGSNLGEGRPKNLQTGHKKRGSCQTRLSFL